VEGADAYRCAQSPTTWAAGTLRLAMKQNRKIRGTSLRRNVRKSKHCLPPFSRFHLWKVRLSVGFHLIAI
jgi:hypothetical protein